MKIVTVIPLEKGAHRGELTYFTAQNIAIGDIALVPLRSKKTLGLVINESDVSESKGELKDMLFHLKKVSEVKGKSIFTEEFLEATLKNGEYFAAKKNYAVATLIPGIFKEKYDKLSKFKIADVKPKNFNSSIRAEKLLFQAPFDDRISYYKTLIRENFAKKKSVFIVLPTEFDIENFEKMLSKGVEKFTFSFHSKTTPKKTLSGLEELLKTEHPILIIATPPYLSIPRGDIGVIILEHENSGAYKMFARPYFDLRTFVEIYAAVARIKLIMADTLLRFETYGRKEEDHLGSVAPLSFKINFQGDIEVSGKGEKFKVLNDASVEEIKGTILKKKNTFVFSLRKGLATMTICRECHETVMCDNCAAPVVLYISRDGKKRMFACNRCHREYDPETTCKSCGSWNLLPLGIGTDTVSNEIKGIFPLAKVYQLDKENVKTNKQAEKLAKEFEDSHGSILVGTEMAMLYLKEKVNTSVIASFDSLWSIPNFRMGEKIIGLLYNILSKTKNKLIIQTKNERDGAVTAVRTDNLLGFVRSELEDRKNLGYPPYFRFIKITHLGTKEQAIEARRVLGEIFSEYEPEISSGFVAKLKGKYATNALIKVKSARWSHPEISFDSYIDETLLNKLLALPPQFAVNVDPEDLL